MSGAIGPILSPSSRLALRGVAIVALGGLAGSIAASPERGFSSLLASSFHFLTLGLGGVVLLALFHVAKAAWLVPLKRVPEALGAYVLAGAASMLLVLPGVHSLYHWSHAEAVAADPILRAKSAYLDVPFFAARMAAALLVWCAFSAALRRLSLRQDADRSVEHTHRAVALSAGFLAVFAVTFSMASFDWLMSLEPHWVSTIFAFYNIAGLLAGGVAAVTAVTLFLRRRGLLPQVTTEHLHNLGKLLLGFCTLWAYMWLSQFLLIWYANLPEETPYYLTRTQGGWGFLFWANLIIGWTVPFLLLLRRRAKRSEGALIIASAVVLAARWLDAYLMVMPANHAVHPGIGLPELAGYLGVGAVFVLVVERALGRAPLLPAADPYLTEGLHHHA